MSEQLSGPKHPATLNTRLNLAGWTGEAGDPAGARDQYRALLLVCERVLGPEHPATLNARLNVAYWTASRHGEHPGASMNVAGMSIGPHASKRRSP